MQISKYNEEDSVLFPIQESPENKQMYYDGASPEKSNGLSSPKVLR